MSKASEEARKYEVVTEEQVKKVHEAHSWISEPINAASEKILEEPFFKWLENVKDVAEFKKFTPQLWYHSATFPKVMGLMLALTPLSENHMMPFYSLHIYGEADHHEMLMDWMLEHKILNEKSEIDYVIPTIATNACVNLVYQIALERDRAKWLACLNSGIERCSNHLFIKLSNKLEKLNANHDYFKVHVEADTFHSIMGLEYLDSDLSDFQKEVILTKALEGISLWGFMLNSWIGINRMPQFDLKGNLI